MRETRHDELQHQPDHRLDRSGRARSPSPALLAGLLIVLFVGISPTASAQFQGMDRQGPTTQFGVDFSTVFREGSANVDVLRTDFFAQLYIPSTDFAIYAALPLSHSFDGPSEATGLGNLEIGAVERIAFAGPLSLTMRLGAAFPTANSSAEEALANIAGSIARVNDALAQGAPESWAIRGSISPRFDFGLLFLQGDLGLDGVFPTEDGTGSRGVFRANLGAGLNIMAAKLTAEIHNVAVLGGDDFGPWMALWPVGAQGDVDTFLHSFSVGLSFGIPFINPYVAFSMPLNDGLRNEVYTLTAGAALRF